jgi:hypothetical protein
MSQNNFETTFFTETLKLKPEQIELFYNFVMPIQNQNIS